MKHHVAADYNSDDKYYSFKATRSILGVTPDTLRRWAQIGKLQTIRTPGNVRMFNKSSVENLIRTNCLAVKPKKQAICYARVSSRKQMDDLERQVALFKDRFPDHLLVRDIGSGINWKRPGLRSILERASRGEISEIVVAHRDRLCRFGFELVEFVLQNLFKCKLRILENNDASFKSSDSDLADDILSIVHIYSCRNMGRRRYTNTKQTTTQETNGEANEKDEETEEEEEEEEEEETVS